MSDLSAIEPNLRFPSFIESYKETTLEEFFTFKNGVNAEKGSYGTGRKFINVLDIIADRPITYDTIIGSVAIDDAEFQKNEVVYGDVLFQRSSETREEVGQSNIYLDNTQSATFGGFVIRGRPKKKFVPQYFNALLRTARVRKDMTSRSGGSTRYNISQESLEKVIICLTTDEGEQQKIAAFLSAVDEKIAQLMRKKALLEDYKKGCMQQLFSQKIRFKDDRGNDFPSWTTFELGELLGYEQPTAYLVSNSDYSDEYEIPVLTAGKTFVLGFTDDKDGICSDIPCILFDDFTTASQFVDFQFKVKSSAAKILRPRSSEISALLVFEIMQFIQFDPASHKRHWISEFQSIPVEFPCFDEQLKILNFIEAMREKGAAVDEQIQLAQTFKKGLLQQMFV